MVCSALLLASLAAPPVRDSSPLPDKARHFQQDLIDKHLLEGLYVSIVAAAAPGTRLPHTVDQPGNVIHAGVWTGRYLAGVGYQYAVTKDPWVRKHGGEILQGLRRLQEVTGKPGLLARGYVKGHGPVEGWERSGNDSREWHQGQGKYADYRWYGDVSVDNFNAVLYGYAVYFDLAADAAQKKFIAYDVDRLMTHLLDNHCRIIDVDGEVTLYGHVGIDPDPAREGYYRKEYAQILARYKLQDGPWRPPLRASLMLLPDLLVAHRITGKPRYLDFYNRVTAAFRDNPDSMRDTRPYSLERIARVNHSSEGQAYEALYNLIRYERDPELAARYRQWMADLWELNWMEGNSLFTYMTLALLPRAPHAAEARRAAERTLRLYPVDRIFRPVMNSIRKDIEQNPHTDRFSAPQGANPLPINQRPLDNEYTWKGNPYQLDGWLKPGVTGFQFACDDPRVAWFSDATGRIYMTRDGMKTWQDMSGGLMGARVRRFAVSGKRTFVLTAETEKGTYITRDGGMSWRPTTDTVVAPSPVAPVTPSASWRIPICNWTYQTPHGIAAGGPGGAWWSTDGGATWSELKLWREEETGAADFLHAYWMGSYYGFIVPGAPAAGRD